MTMSPGTSCRAASAMLLSHISKKLDWMSVPSFTGSIALTVLPSAVFMLDRRRELPGYASRSRREDHGEIRGCRLVRARMCLCSTVLFSFGCVAAHASTYLRATGPPSPRLGQAVVGIRPLCHNMRVSLVFGPSGTTYQCLAPLAGPPCSALVLDDWPSMLAHRARNGIIGAAKIRRPRRPRLHTTGRMAVAGSIRPS